MVNGWGQGLKDGIGGGWGLLWNKGTKGQVKSSIERFKAVLIDFRAVKVV